MRPLLFSIALMMAFSAGAKTIVVLDPGHGRVKGPDYRYHYQRPEVAGLREDNLTLKISKYARDKLRRDNRLVALTRESIYAPYKDTCQDYRIRADDTIPSCNEDLKLRARIASYYKRKYGKAVFVSIHTNAGKGIYLYGHTQAYYCSEISRPLALNLDIAIRELTGDGPKYDPHQLGYPGLIQTCGYGVLKKTAQYGIPGSLLEVLYHDNKSDQFLLSNEAFLKKAGESIAYAIEKYLNEYIDTQEDRPHAGH